MIITTWPNERCSFKICNVGKIIRKGKKTGTFYVMASSYWQFNSVNTNYILNGPLTHAEYLIFTIERNVQLTLLLKTATDAVLKVDQRKSSCEPQAMKVKKHMYQAYTFVLQYFLLNLVQEILAYFRILLYLYARESVTDSIYPLFSFFFWTFLSQMYCFVEDYSLKAFCAFFYLFNLACELNLHLFSYCIQIA